jgi:hypothetical protein
MQIQNDWQKWKDITAEINLLKKRQPVNLTPDGIYPVGYKSKGNVYWRLRNRSGPKEKSALAVTNSTVAISLGLT